MTTNVLTAIWLARAAGSTSPLPQTVQRAQATLPCVHHPRMEDTLLNRVLLAGLHFAAGLAADGELKGHVRRLSKRLGEAVSEQRLDASLIVESWRSMDRRTVAYEPALTLINCCWTARAWRLDEEGSRMRLKGFLFDMNRFFRHSCPDFSGKT